MRKDRGGETGPRRRGLLEVKRLVVLLVILSFLTAPVLGTHTISALTLSTSGNDAYIRSGVEEVFNFTLAVTGGDNVTEVTITIPLGFNVTSTYNITNWTVSTSAAVGEINLTYYNNTPMQAFTDVFNLTVKLNVSAPANGNYTFLFTTLDNGSNTQVAGVNVTVDNAPPAVVIIFPVNTTHPYSNISFNASAHDITTAVNAGILEINSGANYSLVNQSGSWNYYNASMPDGQYYAKFYFNDSAGNWNNSEVVYFTVDTTPPPMTIISPVNGSTTSDTTPLLNATFGEVVNATWYSVNGTTNSTPEWNASNLTVELLQLSSGLHNVTVYANDSFGNLNFSISYFTVETAPPEIYVRWPENLSVMKGTNITASILEAYAGSAFAEVDNSSDGSWNFNLTLANSSGVWSNSSQLFWNDGNYSVKVWANDTAGNSNYSNIVEFEIDATPPKITINYPANISYPNKKVPIQVGIAEANWHTVIAELNNGTNFTISTNTSGTWTNSSAITIAEGSYGIRIFANDTLGNSNYSTGWVYFMVDLTVPSIVINYPTTKNYQNATWFNATVTDNLDSMLNVTVQIDGTQNYTLQNSSRNWNYQNLSGLQEGNHSARFFANDSAGNMNASEVVNFTIDRTVPGISIIRPADSSWQPNSLFIQVNISDYISGINNTATATQYQIFDPAIDINWYSLTYNGVTGYYEASRDISAYPEGPTPIYLRVRASDDAGNANDTGTGEALADFTRDATKPKVTNIIPADGAHVRGIRYINATVDEGTLSGVNSSLIYANVSNSTWSRIYVLLQGAFGGLGTYVWYNATWNTTQLADGTYNITMNVSDNAGNINGTERVNITIDNTMPGLTILAPSNQSYYNATWFNATASDNFGIALLNVTVQVAGVNYSLSNSSGNWNYQKLSGLADGNYNARFFVNDTAGNMNASEVVYFTIDRTPPSVNIRYPENKSYSNATWFNATVTDNLHSLAQLNVTVQIDGNKNYTLTNSSGNWNYQNLSGLHEANHVAQFFANDSLGNMNASEKVYFTIDRGMPLIRIIKPADGSWQPNSLFIRVNITDSFSGINNTATATQYQIFSPAIDTTWYPLTYNGTTGYYEATRNLGDYAEGLTPIYLRVRASDDAGNLNSTGTGEALADFQKDATNPKVTDILPASGTNLSGVRYINATVSEKFGAGSSLSGVNASAIYANVSNSTFSRIYVLLLGVPVDTGIYVWYNATWDTTQFRDGSYNISINVADNAGNTNTTERVTAVVDNTIPSVTIQYPQPWANLSAMRDLNITTADGTGTGVKEAYANVTNSTNSYVYNLSYDSANARWYNSSWATTGFADGGYNITFNATDYLEFSNATERIAVTVDNQNPRVAIQYPGYGANLSGVHDVNASAYDNGTGVRTVYANVTNSTNSYIYLMSYDAANTRWYNRSLNTAQFKDGYYNLTINATDYYARENASEAVPVVLDNTPPVISVSVNDTDRKVGLEQHVLINATVTDSPAGTAFVNISVNGTALDVASSGNYRWATYIPGTLGTVTINVTANDTASNFNWNASVSLTVGKVDLTLNSSNIMLINSSGFVINATNLPREGEVVTINVTVNNTESTNATEVKVGLRIDSASYANNTLALVEANSTNTTQFTWTPGAGDAGTHNITIVVDPDNTVDELDEGNNNATLNLTVRDGTAPVIVEVTAAPSAADVGQNVTIRANATDYSNVTNVTAFVRNSSGLISTLALYDGGEAAYNDTSAGDGVFSNVWNTSGKGGGTYWIDVNATDQWNFTREAKAAKTVALGYGAEGTYANSNVSTTANVSQEIDAATEANTELVLLTSTNTSGGSITIAGYRNSPTGIELSGVSHIRYVEITPSASLNSSLSWVRVTINYSNSDVSGIDEGTVAVYWWNPAASAWVKLSPGSPYWVIDTGLNASANHVWANLSHFSIFGIGGNLASSVGGAAPTGGGGPGAKPAEKEPEKEVAIETEVPVEVAIEEETTAEEAVAPEFAPAEAPAEVSAGTEELLKLEEIQEEALARGEGLTSLLEEAVAKGKKETEEKVGAPIRSGGVLKLSGQVGTTATIAAGAAAAAAATSAAGGGVAASLSMQGAVATKGLAALLSKLLAGLRGFFEEYLEEVSGELVRLFSVPIEKIRRIWRRLFGPLWARFAALLHPFEAMLGIKRGKKEDKLLNIFGYETLQSELNAMFATAFLLAVAYAIPETNELSDLLFLVPAMLIAAGCAIVGREVMHDIAARRYGSWGKYETWNMGVGLMFLTSIFFGTVFAAPGKTVVQGAVSKRESGIISLSAALLNLFFALAFLSIAFKGGILGRIGYSGIVINLGVATYNLMPIRPMDGWEIYDWSKLVWVVVTIPIIFIYMTVFM